MGTQPPLRDSDSLDLVALGKAQSQTYLYLCFKLPHAGMVENLVYYAKIRFLLNSKAVCTPQQRGSRAQLEFGGLGCGSPVWERSL